MCMVADLLSLGVLAQLLQMTFLERTPSEFWGVIFKMIAASNKKRAIGWYKKHT